MAFFKDIYLKQYIFDTNYINISFQQLGYFVFALINVKANPWLQPAVCFEQSSN